MTAINRRSMVLGSAIAIAALAAPASSLARGRTPSLFIFDGRIARARAAAAAYRAAGVAVLDRDRHDLGRAWRGWIPAHALARGGSIVGLTLWVDSYICETFGSENGLAMQRARVAAGDDLHTWILT